MISHDLNLIRKNCDKIHVMKSGEIVESGKCETIFKKPKHAYTKHLLDSIPKSLTERFNQKKDIILDAKNICVNFPTKKNFFGKPKAFLKAVNNISLKVYEGQTLGIVGEKRLGQNNTCNGAVTASKL